MKTQTFQTRVMATLLGLLWLLSGLQAQNGGDYFSVTGIVKNKSNKKKLEQVTVSAVGSPVSTVTNEDGEFTIKIPRFLQVKEVEFSAAGFFNLRIPVSNENLTNQAIFLTPRSIQLDEIQVISWKDPRMLIEAAIDKITDNYSTSSNLLTGFYRETAQKGRKYINISEAVISIYKTSYNEDAEQDKVQILKGRKLLSIKASDTLAVKLLGGPNLSVNVDIVKNPYVLLDKETLKFFRFRMGPVTSIDDRLQYVVHFQPIQVDLPYPLYYGTLYIDRENLAFTRAQFYLDMRDRYKVTSLILKKKPAGLRFNPESVSFTVTYKQRDGKTYLNYIRNEVKFKCDWKRKLFATNYTIVSEMVVTDNQMDDINAIPWKAAFRQNQSLSDKVMSFYDPDFWGAYNIIEPTESLDSAVDKLKKQQE